jgi:hypothetical protein
LIVSLIVGVFLHTSAVGCSVHTIHSLIAVMGNGLSYATQVFLIAIITPEMFARLSIYRISMIALGT